jgi:serine/threonine protein kinase
LAADSLIGRQLDEYRLVALLGHGGMARVYRALDLNLRRFAAIKVIDTQHRADLEYLVRFEREAQTIAQLDHPHIVRLYRYGNVSGLFYMAMQYVQGADLEYVLASYRADGTFIDPLDANRIMKEICLALDYAHQQGVIHRDVKPSNIMLDSHGQSILTDFGLALLPELGTRGEILGSPHYVAPEQAVSSAKAVPQSDLYSLGVILFEMFTGRLPFDAPDPLDVALMQINATPPQPRQLRPELGLELEAVILKALAKDPEQRYPTGQALSEAVQAALAAQPIVEPQPVPSTVSHLSIPERVAREIALNPLPSAGVDSAPPEEPPGTPPETQPLAPGAPPGARRRRLMFGAGIALAVVLLFALCALLAWTASSLGHALSVAMRASATTLTSSPAPTATSAATAFAAATASAEASQVTPTSPVIPLLIVKSADGQSLIIVNEATQPLPLAPLQLGKGRGSIGGGEWNLTQLDGGACLMAVAGDQGGLPPYLHCNVEGQTVRRQGKQRFWQATFEIYYHDAPVGACSSDANPCSLTISP